MIKADRLMNVLLENGKDPVLPEDKTALKQCLDKLFSDIVFENGCLFMKTYNGQADSGKFSDKTEFEACQNEILINSEFPERQVTAAFAMDFFKKINGRLADKNSGKNFGKICSVLSEDGGRWSFGFHIVRADEPMWIFGDIENFSQPVLYEIF